MRQIRSEELVRDIFHECGIELQGDGSCDIELHDDEFFARVLRDGSLGFGESYMDGQWDARAVDEVVTQLMRHNIEGRLRTNPRLVLYYILNRLQNPQSKARAREDISSHYDLGNDIFERMLDPLMNYSCGYWAEADNLDDAQRAKLDLICRKLQIEPGMHVLDIGCGWGGFAWYAATEYGARVTGVTLSREQCNYAREKCRDLPVDILLEDYRDVDLKTDRIVSIGMFEHVGYKNYREYMQVAARCLAPGGLMLLHTIGNNETSFDNDPWMDRYIFPHGEIPSVPQISEAFEGIFVLEDWHSFGPDYDRTLMAWKHNFDAAWPELRDRYGERFYRMWTFYLMFCAGLFRSRRLQLWQVVLSAGDRAATYRSAR